MNAGCRVTVFVPWPVSEMNLDGVRRAACPDPVVNEETGLCKKHQADRERLMA